MNIGKLFRKVFIVIRFLCLAFIIVFMFSFGIKKMRLNQLPMIVCRETKPTRSPAHFRRP